MDNLKFITKSNLHHFLKHSKVSVRKHRAFRRIQLLEFVELDRTFVELPETTPIPIVNTLIGDYFTQKRFRYWHVFCELFWIGQQYHCWVGLTNTQYSKLPTYSWSHLTHP